MSIDLLLIKRNKLKKQIQKLEELSKSNLNTKFNASSVLDDALYVASTISLPFTTLSLYGYELITDIDSKQPRPVKIALGVPCILVGAALTVPIVAPIAAISATAEGIRTSRAIVNSKRIDKLPETIARLKKEKAEIEAQIKKELKKGR